MTGVQITVHRSARQIGGNCIEIAFSGHRLLLDAGRPLDAPRETEPGALFPASLDLSTPIEGLLISHAHLDHYGLAAALPKAWQVWSGNGAAALIRLTATILGRPMTRNIRQWDAWREFQLGPFRITPFLTDHSAFDAYMLLIDVAGRRILYTGDFRLHGRKHGVMERLMAAPPKGVHALVMEGTNLGTEKPCLSESQLETQFVELFEQTEGRVFVAWSAQNIDRTVTLLRACRRTNRKLVIDLYTADVLMTLRDALGSHADGIPAPEWPEMRIVITRRMKRLYQRIGRIEHINRVLKSGHAISADRLADKLKDWVVMVRPSLIDDYAAKGVQLTTTDVWSYSMWRGYLDGQDGQALAAWFGEGGAKPCHIHTSGHASPADLRAFADAIAPERIFPIHGANWLEFAEGFQSCAPLVDGQPIYI